MSYYVKVDFDDQFSSFLMHLKSKYPEKLFNIDGIGTEQTDLNQFSKDFFSTRTTVSDASIDANSNVAGIDVTTYVAELPKPLMKLNSYYVLWKKIKQLYGHEQANRIIEKALIGDIYINDMHLLGAGISYCYNYSANDVAQAGLPMISKIMCVPPKHLLSFKSQLEQFVIIASNNTAGATGLADIFVTMSMYIDKILKTGRDSHFYFEGWNDVVGNNEGRVEPYNKNVFEHAVWTYVRENIASFIYTINQPMRGGIQSPFTNVSVFDDGFLDTLIPNYSLVDGDKIYNAEKDIVKRLQLLFLDIMNEEMKRTVFTFPVTTACFTINDNKEINDVEFLQEVTKRNLDFGFINFYIGKSSTLSSCCRLRSEMDNRFFVQQKSWTITFDDGTTQKYSSEESIELDSGDFLYVDEIKDKYKDVFVGGKKIVSINEENVKVLNEERAFANSFGSGSVQIGSIGVATLNLPRVAYKNSDNEDKFIEELKSSAEDSCKINHAKRHIVQKRIDSQNAPLYNHNFINIKKQYSTIGIIGLKEAVEIMGYDIMNEEGQAFVFKILDALNGIADKYERITKYPHNLEQIPGESAAVKLAEKDKLLKYQTKEYAYPFYSNQFIPLISKADLLDRIKLQGMFDSQFSGGSILHINVETKIDDASLLDSLVKLAAQKGVVYFAINYAIKECEDKHIEVRFGTTCSCGKEYVAIYSRPVGYLTKVATWSKTKREEDFANRKFYDKVA